MPGLKFPAPVPRQQHFVCRDGYYYHHLRPDCIQGYTSLSVEEVEACFEGRALARAAAIASITQGQRLALYPVCCSACSANHYKMAENLARAWKRLTPKGREACEKLGAREIYIVCMKHGETPEETERLQVLHAASVRLGRSRRKPTTGDEG